MVIGDMIYEDRLSGKQLNVDRSFVLMVRPHPTWVVGGEGCT